MVCAEANGVRAKIFSVFFFRELGYFVHLGYFSPCHALIGRYVVNLPPGNNVTMDLTARARISTLRFKYSHHASGQAHFSLSRQLPPEIRNATTPLTVKLGHVFTAIFRGIESFARVAPKDAGNLSTDRLLLTFRFDDLETPPGKFVAWWYPLRAVTVAELGPGLPWEPKPSTLQTRDGRLLNGFLVAPPMDWNWNDYGLLIAADTQRNPNSSLDAFLLFQGGVAVERDEAGNELEESFIAALFTDRTDDLKRLTQELGTLDMSRTEDLSGQ